jgi:hypothetical protein
MPSDRRGSPGQHKATAHKEKIAIGVRASHAERALGLLLLNLLRSRGFVCAADLHAAASGSPDPTTTSR